VIDNLGATASTPPGGAGQRFQPPNGNLANAATTASELRAAGEREWPILGEPEVGSLLALCCALFAVDARRTDLTLATGATGTYGETACPATEAMAETDMIESSSPRRA
jgi:hypothetical protein